MGTEAIGSSCRRSNHTRSTDHRGKTVIVASGSLEGSSILRSYFFSPCPFLRENNLFLAAKVKKKKRKKKKTERGEKKKAELFVTVMKTEHKAKQKGSCKMSVQFQCPFSS